MYYYDTYGWLSADPLPGRETNIAPPQETQTLKAYWLGEGWSLMPYTPPPEISPEPVTPVIPDSCSPAQGLVALFALKGVTESAVNAAISAITDPVLRYTTQIAFARATEWRRDSVSTQQLATLLELTDAELDELFVFAVTVNV